MLWLQEDIIHEPSRLTAKPRAAEAAAAAGDKAKTPQSQERRLKVCYACDTHVIWEKCQILST